MSLLEKRVPQDSENKQFINVPNAEIKTMTNILFSTNKEMKQWMHYVKLINSTFIHLNEFDCYCLGSREFSKDDIFSSK